MKKKLSRGYKNCNPGNIRQNNDVYQGEIIPSQDAAFKQFRTMAYGYRAMFVLLSTISLRRGCKTIETMIRWYAPPSENKTEKYIQAVVKETGIARDVELNVDDHDTMSAVVAAMSFVENGVRADAADIETGWRMYKSRAV